MHSHRQSQAKNSFAIQSLIAGLAIVALSACTTTAPTPAPTVASATANSANSTQLLPSQTPTGTTASEPTSSGSTSPTDPEFSADSIKILEHKIIDDPTAKNLQVKVQAPKNTTFFTGAQKAVCESEIVDAPPITPSKSGADSESRVTYLLRCQDQNPTTELTASIEFRDFHSEFVVPLK